MFQDAVDSFSEILTPPFRMVLWKSLALTLVLLLLTWVGLERLILHFADVQNGWLATAIGIAAGLGLFAGCIFLVGPTTSLVAGFFIDELAARVEAGLGPATQVGRPLPAGTGLWVAIQFAVLSLAVNAVALLLLLVPGVNVVAFFAANAFLFGREYFALAALRYRSLEEVRGLRRRHATYLFLCGLPIALLLAIPVLNLLTPLFATAFMVRVHRRITPAPANLPATALQA